MKNSILKKRIIMTAERLKVTRYGYNLDNELRYKTNLKYLIIKIIHKKWTK